MILVAGLGNLLMGDDGIGSRAIEYLEREAWPEDVTFADLGTPGLGLGSFLAGCDSLILIDAINAEGTPGEVRRYGKPQLLTMATGPRLGPHDPSIADTLTYLDMTEQGPRQATLLGVVAGPCELGVGLSGGVEASLPVLSRLVRDEVNAAIGGPNA